CFFQAEDGIRDRNVSGVQTCALPISRSSWEPYTSSSRRTSVTAGCFDRPVSRFETFVEDHSRASAACSMVMPAASLLAFICADRSEERRVGKEYGLRWERARLIGEGK